MSVDARRPPFFPTLRTCRPALPRTRNTEDLRSALFSPPSIPRSGVRRGESPQGSHLPPLRISAISSRRGSSRFSFSDPKRSGASQRYRVTEEGAASVPRVWHESGVLGSSLVSVRVAASAPLVPQLGRDSFHPRSGSGHLFTASRTYCFLGAP
ncbi:hypothetical protein NDU88_008879 [Pleurodeles waltl]|uniref:Uncharacterized protein n=1 Tax=Pleurodeles waltl TaxID=8319 RepID=A0AAV7RYY8_PLEWA|nr:hypothetical protein NDU88_008879 [Pleurodeles waltl]